MKRQERLFFVYTAKFYMIQKNSSKKKLFQNLTKLLSLSRKITNHTSHDMLKELSKVLKEDLKFNEENIKISVDLVLGYSISMNLIEKVDAVKDDSKDNIILECALACNADYIVSGDRLFLI